MSATAATQYAAEAAMVRMNANTGMCKNVQNIMVMGLGPRGDLGSYWCIAPTLRIVKGSRYIHLLKSKEEVRLTSP